MGGAILGKNAEVPEYLFYAKSLQPTADHMPKMWKLRGMKYGWVSDKMGALCEILDLDEKYAYGAFIFVGELNTGVWVSTIKDLENGFIMDHAAEHGYWGTTSADMFNIQHNAIGVGAATITDLRTHNDESGAKISLRREGETHVPAGTPYYWMHQGGDYPARFVYDTSEEESVTFTPHTPAFTSPEYIGTLVDKIQQVRSKEIRGLENGKALHGKLLSLLSSLETPSGMNVKMSSIPMGGRNS
jgi:hypothetical protein